MAVKAVASHDVSIALACRTFQISETCYRYERKLSDGNAEIADWLVRLTTNRRTWGVRIMLSVSAQRPSPRSASLAVARMHRRKF